MKVQSKKRQQEVRWTSVTSLALVSVICLSKGKLLVFARYAKTKQLVRLVYLTVYQYGFNVAVSESTLIFLKVVKSFEQ